MIRFVWLVTVAVLLIPPPHPAAANLVYSFADPGLSFGYGWSGTITTDGSTGDFTSIAAFEAVLVDYNLTFNTPGDTDGVTSQLLTPSNSTLSLLYFGGPGLRVTATQITFPPTGGGGGTNRLTLDVDMPAGIGAETIRWSSSNGTSVVGVYLAFDDSEMVLVASSSSGGVGDTLLVATAVPEPGAFLMCGLVGLGFVAWKKLCRSPWWARWARWRARCQEPFS